MNVTELYSRGKETDASGLAGIEADKSNTKQVDILIHTRNALDQSTAEYVIKKLNHVKGVYETRYSPARNHLLIVSYHPHIVEPVQLLAVMRALGHEAQLVGL